MPLPNLVPGDPETKARMEMERREADPPGPSPRTHARLSVVETVYHQAVGEPARAVPSRFSRWLRSTEEESFQRSVRVGEDWTPVEASWVVEASHLMLENREGRALVAVPTDRERAETEARVVEMGVLAEGGGVVPFLRVPPGESCRFTPAELSRLRVRCLHGRARCLLTVVPA